jgi:FAD/FMN-containing dehydrogenase
MSVIVRTSNAEMTVAADVLERFRSSLTGTVLTDASRGYDEARTVWNAMIDRRPAVIARCENTQDVVQSVRFASDRQLVLAVRGGGHNIAGTAVCDGGFMIDLSPMRRVHVDPEQNVARVEPGVTLGEFDAAAQKFGLATPVGINSTTGIAGLALGGGFGWLSRRLGLTIDNLLEVEVVTAFGDIVRASEREHADLFWAIRGGGGNFGVVTEFVFRMHAVGPEILAGIIVHPLSAARDVVRFYRDFVADAPEELACWFVMRHAPPLPFLPREWHGKEILALAVCYSGEVAEGERVSEPLRNFGSPLADVIVRQPYRVWQTALDPLLTPGQRNYWKSLDFRYLSDGLIDTFIDFAGRIPDPQTEIAFAQLGGAVSRVPPDATAYTHRDAEFKVNVHGRWSESAQDEACIRWARALFTAAAPFATGGVYVNFLTQDEADRIPAAYGVNYARLVRLKDKYDPTNLFRVNQNIRPSATPMATE